MAKADKNGHPALSVEQCNAIDLLAVGKTDQEVATLIHCEEFAHSQWQEEAWTAMRPVVQGGGKIVVVSTPLAGSFFRDLVFDEGSIRSEAL